MADPRIDALLPLLARHREDVARAFHDAPAARREAAPGRGAWSVAHVVEHLADTERGITGLLAGWVAVAEPRPGDEPFDAAAFADELDMPFFLERTRRVRGSQPSGALSAAEAWAALVASRQALLRGLEQARGRRLEPFSRRHPATGAPLNAYQWLAFLALHEGRHAAQIREIVARLEGAA